MRISDWSSDVCSSDLLHQAQDALQHHRLAGAGPADHDKRFARIDAEVDSIQHGLAAKALDHALKRDLWPGKGVAVVHQPHAITVRMRLESRISTKADTTAFVEIGRESCRERVCQEV